jgi:hypothetical protein
MRLVRSGLVLFAIGIVFVAIDVVPFFADDHNTPLWLNLACLAAPAGFVLALWGVLRRGRADQRRALAELANLR